MTTVDLLNEFRGVRTLATPALLAVRGQAALDAWGAWNAALGERCDHELSCTDGCRDTLTCCPVGARLAVAEQDAYVAWDVIASKDDAVAEDAPIEACTQACCNEAGDVLIGLRYALRITVTLWIGLGLGMLLVRLYGAR